MRNTTLSKVWSFILEITQLMCPFLFIGINFYIHVISRIFILSHLNHFFSHFSVWKVSFFTGHSISSWESIHKTKLKYEINLCDIFSWSRLFLFIPKPARTNRGKFACQYARVTSERQHVKAHLSWPVLPMPCIL